MLGTVLGTKHALSKHNYNEENWFKNIPRQYMMMYWKEMKKCVRGVPKRTHVSGTSERLHSGVALELRQTPGKNFMHGGPTDGKAELEEAWCVWENCSWIFDILMSILKSIRYIYSQNNYSISWDKTTYCV